LTPITIRRLTYADLPQVIAVERRAFPTPWSLAMFVLELSKPSGICLAAWREDSPADEHSELAGYLICSRYDTVWHVMNVSVDPSERRNGVATQLLEAVIDRIGDPEAQFTLEVRVSNAPAIALYERFGFLTAGMRRRYYQDNGEDALIMWRTPMTLRGRLDDVPNAGPVLPSPS
jgi:[ribosomal protein S18]-alanine N-acetyltransferase